MKTTAGWLTIALMLGLSPKAAMAQDTDAEARQIAAKVCSACHGPGGDGTNPQFPKLAAQQPDYLAEQLKAFRTRQRAEPDAQHFMWGAASRDLDERVVGAMARYYAAQPAPKPVAGDAALVARGRQLFSEGASERQIPACAGCHGADAHGVAAFPRLAGQHAAYLEKQMRLIQSAVRSAPVMHGIIQKLNDGDMRALAAFLQSAD